MKSIKEKAKEYHRVIRVLNKHSVIVDTQCSEMFVEGANYVLDEIEKLVKFNRWTAQDLYELIEQLKK
jgi:hypothetical protein